MKATYYRIKEYNRSTQKEGNIVLEGIIRDSEDTIYPGQEFIPEDGEMELPYECEAHHFKHPNYILEMWEIEISRELCEAQKTHVYNSVSY